MSRAEIRNTQELRQALAAGHKPEQLVMVDCDAIAAEARAEGFSAGQEESKRAWQAERSELVRAATEGLHPDTRATIAAEERGRITAIQELVEPGLERIGAEAIARGLSAEQFALMQVREMKDRGISLSAMRRDSPPAADHAAPPADGYGSAPKRREDTKSVYGRRKDEVAGKAPR